MQLCTQNQAQMFTFQVPMPVAPVTGTEKQED